MCLKNCLIGGLLMVCIPLALGDAVVLAPRPAGAAADSASEFPFLIKQGGIATMRYQQVYAASAFSALNPGGENITNMFFYLGDKLANRDYFATVTNIQISLSTTTRNVDSLSAVFADNVGADNQTIYGPAKFSFSGGIGSGIQIPMSHPFFYNPAAGNLLLDVRVFNGSGPINPTLPAFWAQNSFTDEVSEMFATDVNASTATFSDTIGLRTGFGTQSVPEPNTVYLVSLGGIAFLTLARNRTRRN